MSKKDKKVNPKKARKLKAKEYSFKEIDKLKREDGLKMRCVKKYTFRDFVEAISARYSNRLCYTVIGGEDEVSFSYRYLAFKVHAASQYLLKAGVKKGDKICIYGESCPTWMIFYLGLTSIGAVAVPILPGFSGHETIVALEDAGCVGICAQSHQFYTVKDYVLEKHMIVIRMEDLFRIDEDTLAHLDDKNYLALPGVDITHTKFNMKELNALPLEEDDVASVIYTSGTTGASKGVVLTHKNILWNADVCTDFYITIKPGMRVLSLLPVSHIYEFTIGQILTMMTGCEIHFLGKAPAVSILLPALKSLRPQVILSVPLLIEKVYRSAVAPLLREEGTIKSLYNNKLTRRFVCRLIGRKLKATFGGSMKFFGIGGAALDPEVEAFLSAANFPYAIGYGLTETSPLIAGCGPKCGGYRLGFAGRVMKGEEVKILDVNEEGIGEIAVKGPNVSPGYYNNPELNKEAFTKDGFFRTGDLGLIDKKGRLGIKGRCKTVILGPSGENIYPEAIESLINNMEFVEESLVVPEGAGLLALIKIDVNLMAKKMKLDINDAQKEAKKYVSQIKTMVNKELSKQNRLDSAKLQDEPFERTASNKIKRFLYPKKNKKDSEEKE